MVVVIHDYDNWSYIYVWEHTENTAKKNILPSYRRNKEDRVRYMISGFMNSTLDQKWLGRLRQRGYYEQEYLLLGMGWTRNGYKILAGKR